MLHHPNIDPVAIKLGPLAIHWYGLMYLLGFWGAWRMALRRARLAHVGWSRERISDLLFYVVMGVILGGRLGYVLFYAYDNSGHWLPLDDPMMVLRVWQGGMSFHGGLIGVLLAMGLFAYLQKLKYFEVADFAAVLVPIGLFTGRIGNFINGELWGKPTELPWGMVFETAPDLLPRHPSMLYEALLEGLVMFAVLWWVGGKPRPRGLLSALFLLLYGTFRFAVEFVRVPDTQLGYLHFGWMTRGQELCLPMLAAGLIILAWSLRKKEA
ncbi:phosphatidylglycerol:prolipoprotein diacylglycerol transferase [Solimonas aquatica]|uniref:Phosphatidylglycerol--prolipoprotein diacylglyceryl transferase n=1 Tax=Solimonas aquatica TaxID=489703 RepID=A0A1H9CEU6_9GAMM|nr:prolipoprotein diacylglyceryl transferase [Solimonas aquatica]SEP99537.1 phosphatidylglycerol:prolipoprotein diacylglycerol transferase [Solimonas aquatica]